MNKPAWSKLTEKERQLLVDSISDNLVVMMIDFEKSVKEALAESKDHAVIIHEPADDLKNELSGFIASDVMPMALDVGQRLEVKDSEGLIERFQATHAKWTDLLADVDRSDVGALQKIFHDEIYSKVDVSTYGLN
jgi:hypothetical protein